VSWLDLNADPWSDCVMRRPVFLFGFLSAALVGGVSASVAATAPSVVPAHHATKSIVVRPVTPSGKPAAGFHAKKEKDAIDCENAGPSLGAVDPNIDECSPSAAYAIACWKSSHAGRTLCTRDPSTSKLYDIPLTSTFGKTSAPKPKQRAPLLVVLKGGAVCSIRIGGAGAILKSHPNWFTTYYCDNNKAIWASPHAKHYGINESHKRWRVHVASSTGHGHLKTRHVAKAYFVGTAT
jgi:hypothetical protein